MEWNWGGKRVVLRPPEIIRSEDWKAKLANKKRKKSAGEENGVIICRTCKFVGSWAPGGGYLSSPSVEIGSLYGESASQGVASRGEMGQSNYY